MKNQMAAISGVLGGEKAVGSIFRAYEKYLGLTPGRPRGAMASGTEKKISHTEEAL
jgi:hypothetical protein